MTDFTPGPWIVVNDCESLSILTDENREGVCRMSFLGCDKEWQATTRLIAAAPDMYEALKAYDKHIELPKDPPLQAGPKGKAYSDFLLLRDAALAKAEGKT